MKEYILKNYSNIKIPKMVEIKQLFFQREIKDISLEVEKGFIKCKARDKISPGNRVAIAVGSRGIPHLAEIVTVVVREVKKIGAEPFIVPAMGSHGGAEAEGQRKILESYGITERIVGAPIVSSMDTVEIGRLKGNIPIYFDRNAFNAQAIIPINRIKPHTDFGGELGSGLIKLIVIGLGKHKGALIIHRHGVYGLRNLIPQAARMIIKKTPIVFGIGIVEDACKHIAIIRVIEPKNILEEEKKLLIKAKELMPKLPVDRIDLLIVDEMGKEISGSGMDTNVIGRMKIQGEKEPEKPKIKRVLVLNITESSHGNAVGIGLADFSTKKLIERIDYHSFYVNTLTSTFVERGKIPIVLDSDEEAIRAGLATCWLDHFEEARVIRIKNTSELSKMYVSEKILREIIGRRDIEVVGKLREIKFNEEGNLIDNERGGGLIK